MENSSQNESPLRGIKGFSRVAAAQLMVRRTGPVDEFHAVGLPWRMGGFWGHWMLPATPKKNQFGALPRSRKCVNKANSSYGYWGWAAFCGVL